MSRIVMWNLMTVDGSFEGLAKRDLDWHRLVLGDEFERSAIDLLRSADRRRQPEPREWSNHRRRGSSDAYETAANPAASRDYRAEPANNRQP
jgi:hypothetical protein